MFKILLILLILFLFTSCSNSTQPTVCSEYEKAIQIQERVIESLKKSNEVKNKKIVWLNEQLKKAQANGNINNTTSNKN